jgi:CMP/dCMP kinase
MKITISGVAGSGKSTVAKMVAEKLGFKHYSAGDFMREIASDKDVSLLELSEIAEKDRSIDEDLDKRTKKLDSEEDNFVMDSRLAFHFIESSFKVFLDVDDNEAAKRVFTAIQKKSKGREVEKESTTLKSTLEGIKRRRGSEKLRYKKYYNLNPFDKNNYDIVIDTTNMTAAEVAEKIVSAAKP